MARIFQSFRFWKLISQSKILPIWPKKTTDFQKEKKCLENYFQNWFSSFFLEKKVGIWRQIRFSTTLHTAFEKWLGSIRLFWGELNWVTRFAFDDKFVSVMCNYSNWKLDLVCKLMLHFSAFQGSFCGWRWRE